jgi:vancomycin permeability regulator SanA
MTVRLLLALIAVLLFPLKLFSIEVNRLIIVTDKLTPDLYKAILINEYYLSKKGVICKAYTNEQIENCLKLYEAKEIWYIYLGHSNGKNIGDFLSIDTISFPRKVDYIILDACR